MERPEAIASSEPHARTRRRHLAGLPGERTLLAWDRTALALLANAALLTVRDAGGTHPLRLATAILAALLAVMCGVLARTRARTLAHPAGRDRLAAPTAAIYLLAGGVAAIATLELIAIAQT
ncbi:MAG: DUF202 domain-containing protein [Sporichthyaceae bacterium]